MLRSNGQLGTVCLVGVLSACAAEPETESVGSSTSPVVYGADDRLEYYQIENLLLRQRVRESAAALVEPRMLDQRDPADIRIEAALLGEVLPLCEGERFLDQPRAAKCSATLIDDDLVLTAGHCLLDEEDCRRHRFVFDFLLTAPATLETISAEDVYACRRLVVHRWTLLDDDFSLVQLDRPVAPERVAAPVDRSRTGVARGSAVTAIGFGMGVPAKADPGGHVLEPGEATAARLEVAVDAFEAASGMGLYDGELRLVGSLSGGVTDYVEQGSCWRVNQIDEDCAACLAAAGEEFVHVDRALDALCDAEWPSERLCGRAAVCGDGVCSGVETAATCPGDCLEVRCGDGVCDRADVSGGCTEDCGGPADRAPPPEWQCSAPYGYAQYDGCDCDCGAWDPDCIDPGATVYRCPYGATCDSAGQCTAGAVPEQWTCDPLAYAGGDGCHCGCGAHDPDCDYANRPAIGCAEGEICRDGQCTLPRSGDDGCGCRAGGDRRPIGWWGWIAAAGVVLARRRRQGS